MFQHCCVVQRRKLKFCEPWFELCGKVRKGSVGGSGLGANHNCIFKTAGSERFALEERFLRIWYASVFYTLVPFPLGNIFAADSIKIVLRELISHCHEFWKQD